MQDSRRRPIASFPLASPSRFSRSVQVDHRHCRPAANETMLGLRRAVATPLRSSHLRPRHKHVEPRSRYRGEFVAWPEQVMTGSCPGVSATLTTTAFDRSSSRWLGISDLIAEPEGPSLSLVQLRTAVWTG